MCFWRVPRLLALVCFSLPFALPANVTAQLAPSSVRLMPLPTWEREPPAPGLEVTSPRDWLPPRVERRPTALAPLYVSLVAVNVLDIDSTYDALRRSSGREANPVASSLVRQPAVFITAKVGTTAATIWVAEKLWRKHRVAAVAVVAVTNGAMAAVVANNYRVARR